eukprot:TRINITY_DN9550_c4_g1_i1.p1 TRINITY_DN9550_c4_g1~~TRINITY_DN9550_c4_g1_i1.p1  ORF type:complete len:185 (+),score=66.33 TRINITY_DN9550_c4_g1_i1:43-555(+)
MRILVEDLTRVKRMLGVRDDTGVEELREEVSLLKQGLLQKEAVRELEHERSLLRQENEELRTRVSCQDTEISTLRRSKEEILLEVISEKQARIADTEELMLLRERLDQAADEMRSLQDHAAELRVQVALSSSTALQPPLESPRRGHDVHDLTSLHEEMASQVATLEAHLQ